MRKSNRHRGMQARPAGAVGKFAPEDSPFELPVPVCACRTSCRNSFDGESHLWYTGFGSDSCGCRTFRRRPRGPASPPAASPYGGFMRFPLILAALSCAVCWGQAPTDCKPNPLNIPEGKYPCILPDGRALFRVNAPNAQTVRVSLGGLNLTKGGRKSTRVN